MLESQIDQAERRAVLRNDARVREGSTYLDHTTNDTGGRFAQIGAAYVVGSKSDISGAYPAAAAHQCDPVPDEPPLGYAIDAMSDCAGEPPSPLCGLPQPNPAPADATSSSDDYDDKRRDAGLGLSGDPAGSQFPRPPGTSRDVNAGSLPFRRRV
jgi:hypothetical protein